jgi:HEAT repeat protein
MNRLVLIAVTAAALAAAGCRTGLADPRAILVEALESRQPDLQAVALEAYLESGRAAPPLDLPALTDARVRMLACVEAGRRRDPRALPFFRASLRDADESVRLAAAFGLAMAGDGEQALALRDGLVSPTIAVRRNAAWLIGLMNNSSAVDMLKTRLADPDAVVVLRVGEALGRLGSRDGLPRIRELTEYEQHVIRSSAVRLLGRFGTADDLPRLRRLADDSQFLDVKFAAVAALSELGDFRQMVILVELLDAPEKDLRMLAARELADTAYTPALRALSERAQSGDIQERTAAAAAMLRIQSDPRSWRDRGVSEPNPRNPNIFRESDLPPYKGPARPSR